LGKTGDHWVQDRNAGDRKLSATTLKLVTEILVDEREENNAGLAFDFPFTVFFEVLSWHRAANDQARRGHQSAILSDLEVM